MLIPNKHAGYTADGVRRAFISSGGGGSSGTQRVEQTNVPDWARPQFEEMLGRGVALSQAEYQPYTGQRQADFTNLQNQAFGQAEGQQVAGQLGAATGLAGLAAGQGLQAGQFQPGTFTPMGVQAPQLQQFQMGPAQRVSSQSFVRPGTAEQFMNPFMQNVVDIQKREAQRAADIGGTQRGAQAVRAGAFGGSRQAIMDAEAQRNLAQQMGDIQATGSQAAFQQAQEQFNREQQARLQAQMANQQAGLTVGQQNLGALLGIQQLGAGQNLQAQTANQQALMDAQRMFEQSRQFGADLGLRGGAQALQGAQTLGQLGQQQFGQEMDVLGARERLGGLQQQQEQRRLQQQFADFQQQRDFPYQQLGFLSDLLRGAGSSTRSIYNPAQPGALQTIAGLGTAAAGIAGMAEGGEVGYADGGIMSLMGDDQLRQVQSPMDQMAAQEEMMQRQAIRDQAPASMPRETDMTEAELLAAMQRAMQEGDRAKAAVIREIIEDRRIEDSGIAMIAPETAGDIPEGGLAEMAGGGMVSFEVGGGVGSPLGMTDEEFQRLLLEEQAMAGGRGDVAGPTAQEMAAAHRANPRMMQGLPAVVNQPSGNVSTQGGIADVMGPAQFMAAARQFGIDPEAAAERQMELAGQQAEARERGLAQRQSDFERMVEERGVYGKEQEEAARAEVEGLTGKKIDSKNFALIQAGLAILSADPSRGAFAAIGEGAAKGLAGYKGDLEKLDATRDRINSRLDRILELRRAEQTADGRERQTLEAERSKLEELSIADHRKIAGDLDKSKQGLGETMYKAHLAQRAAAVNRTNRVGANDRLSLQALTSARVGLQAQLQAARTAMDDEEVARLTTELNDVLAEIQRRAGVGSQPVGGGGTVDTNNPLLKS